MQPNNWLSDLKVIIFDMDGTLYQDHTFMERYIRYLLADTEAEAHMESAVALGTDILSGSHPVQCGHFYHVDEDVVLVRETGRFIQALNWEGNVVPIASGLADAGADESVMMKQLVPFGDPWGVAAVIGRRYKLPERKRQEAFERVRREMVQEPYRFAYSSSLFEALAALTAVDKKIVMTNTYLESGLEFLHYMQIYPLFDEVYCGAEKPDGIAKYMTELLAQGYKPEQILSVGDNPWNDLEPVRQLGGRTCLISPYASAESSKWDIRLTELDELEHLLRLTQQAITRKVSDDGHNRAYQYQQEV
ncbi:FMN phosphatase YigB (HAD superfamily) [Paenibacillus phyllosphaerae]|uniref:FMN phosphatase YigB (HAD superfamily) n=1 Tax=Paenibacillus phyllosphaerae TaxID=274593 RepID=A0A7W5AZ60_9BACL|nr:HAD family hydrolase [Paenibacillus phyllosphaerae]MBB3111468.1 FMN phosphatase YigB (HAD superfamily) [Paenibacillus phyllosphaerae]